MCCVPILKALCYREALLISSPAAAAAPPLTGSNTLWSVESKQHDLVAGEINCCGIPVVQRDVAPQQHTGTTPTSSSMDRQQGNGTHGQLQICPRHLHVLHSNAFASCRESWDLSKVSPPAAAALTGSRVLWSAKANAKQTSDSISNKVNESLQSLGSMEDDEYYMNPNDPTRVGSLLA